MSVHNLPTPTSYIIEGNEAYLSHIRIPQPDGSEASIVTHEVTVALKMLGVHFSPAGNSDVEHMVQKGLDWVDCLRMKPILHSNTWLSFYLHCFRAYRGVWLPYACLHSDLIPDYRGYMQRHSPFLASTARSSENSGCFLKCIRALVCPTFHWLPWP